MRLFAQHQERNVPHQPANSGKVVSASKRDVAEAATKRAFASQGDSLLVVKAKENIMSAFIIRPGDQVVCIDAELPMHVTARHQLCKDRLTEKAHYRVTAVVWLYGEKGLHLEGMDHTPTDGWRACRFRKILSCEAGQGLCAANQVPFQLAEGACREAGAAKEVEHELLG
jgi:hypothetical protein